mgnify:CR=1 FL=1
MAKRKYKRLHYEDRQTIEAMSKQGSSVSDIAEALGTHRDTIYREFKRCNATLKTYTAVPKMLKAGADVLIEAQRAEAQAMGLNETGGFINSIKATDVKGDDTEKYVEIYPQGRAKHGNDRKGDKSKVRYATIGFVAEYGTSSHAARPYMTVANEKAHEKVVEAQRSIWESETGE